MNWYKRFHPSAVSVENFCSVCNIGESHPPDPQSVAAFPRKGRWCGRCVSHIYLVLTLHKIVGYRLQKYLISDGSGHAIGFWAVCLRCTEWYIIQQGTEALVIFQMFNRFKRNNLNMTLVVSIHVSIASTFKCFKATNNWVNIPFKNYSMSVTVTTLRLNIFHLTCRTC